MRFANVLSTQVRDARKTIRANFSDAAVMIYATNQAIAPEIHDLRKRVRSQLVVEPLLSSSNIIDSKGQALTCL
jgi:hypothetical protein